MYRIRLCSSERIQDLVCAVQAKQMDRAYQLLGEVPAPYRDLLQTGLQHRAEDRIYLEELLDEKILQLQPKLESGLSILAITAGVAPLLGLLGTVTGMIHTFQLLSLFGNGDAQTLSGGISQALISTEYGLALAIPALIMHAIYSRRAQAILASMERMAMSFINGVSRNRNERA